MTELVCKGEPIKFFIQGRPRPQQRVRVVRAINSTKSLAYDPCKAEKLALAVMSQLYAPSKPPKDYVVITLQFDFISLSGSPDLDNLVKLVMDAYNKLFWHDDRQVIKIIAAKAAGPVEATFVQVQYATQEAGSGGC